MSKKFELQTEYKPTGDQPVAIKTLVEGLENAPDALNLLFTGGNTGKVIVAVEPD